MCCAKTTLSNVQVRDARLQLLEAELCAVVITATKGVWERCTSALTCLCLQALRVDSPPPRPSLTACHSLLMSTMRAPSKGLLAAASVRLAHLLLRRRCWSPPEEPSRSGAL